VHVCASLCMCVCVSMYLCMYVYLCVNKQALDAQVHPICMPSVVHVRFCGLLFKALCWDMNTNLLSHDYEVRASLHEDYCVEYVQTVL
jgi:hypothetical protein